MENIKSIGRIGGKHNHGGGSYLRAVVAGAENTVSGARYLIRLIDPPQSLAGLKKCILVGNLPTLSKGVNILVVHDKHNQFIFKALGEGEPRSQRSSLNHIGRADTQPVLAANIAEISSAPTHSGLGATAAQYNYPPIEKGLFVRFKPGNTARILCQGEYLILPDHYILPKENPQHESRFDFVRLNHTVAYQSGQGIQLCCSAQYFKMMEKVLMFLRTETALSAELKNAVPALEYTFRNPGLRKINTTQVGIWQVFPNEIYSEFGYSMPAVFPQYKHEAPINMIHFKLLLEIEHPKTQAIALFNPFGGDVIDLIHYLMFYDFRAIIVKKE